MKKFFTAILVLTSFVSAGVAHATSCQPMVTDLINYARPIGQYLEATVVTNQQNTIASWSGSHWAAALDYDGYYWLITQPSYSSGILYSDRTATVNSRVQPFNAMAPDYFNMQIAPDGSVVWIYSTTWGFWNRVGNLSCDNGVMYGWGASIGNYNSNLPAMYIFSFAKKRNELAP